MHDGEQMWAAAVGAIGLLSFATGSLVVQAPPVDRPTSVALAELTRRRRLVLAGSVASITGAALLLWPLAVVASSGSRRVWPSLEVLSMATWVFGFGFLALGSILLVAVVWRTETSVEDRTARVLLDLSHLAVWSISAPIGAISVLATTAVGVQAEIFGAWVVAAAAAKVVTVGIELWGTGRQRGWNAGGWAYGTSGYVTVAWFALVLIALA